MPRVEIKLNLSDLAHIDRAAMEATLMAVGELRGKMISDQVIPNDNGYLQDSIGAVDQFEEGNELHTTLCVGDTPYARRLYFHPEYNFQFANNPNAQGLWAEHWLEGGDQEDLAPDTFRRCMEARLK